MKIIKIFLTIICISLLLSACFNPSVEDLIKRAEGEYNYEASYFRSESDALVHCYSENKKSGSVTCDKNDPFKTEKGWLVIEGTEGNSKIKITLDNGMCFISNKIKRDVVVNPSYTFNFKIPKQTTDEGEIESFACFKNPDNELFHGSFYGFKGDEEIEFGIKFLDGNKYFIRFFAEFQ
ncbi:MAG: hypothetical protein FWH18_01220 [Marinilabiliaceae bacterium]|nr:hypothetical protein [Marinilabiliaceae bacterium]